MTRHSIDNACVAVLCAALAACTVGPDYVRDSTQAAPAYKESGDWKSATPAS